MPAGSALPTPTQPTTSLDQKPTPTPGLPSASAKKPVHMVLTEGEITSSPTSAVSGFKIPFVSFPGRWWALNGHRTGRLG